MNNNNYNRLTIETANQMFQAATDALNQMQGDNKFGDMVLNSKAFCDTLPVQHLAWQRVAEHEAKKTAYDNLYMGDLHKLLYDKLLDIYHRAACKEQKVPGISWGLEPNGVFAVDLGECAVNMEHSVSKDGKHGTAFTVWLQAPVNANEDPRREDSECYNNYGPFVGYSCEWKNSDGSKDYHDYDVSVIDISDINAYEALLRDTLADFDVIADMDLSEAA